MQRILHLYFTYIRESNFANISETHTFFFRKSACVKKYSHRSSYQCNGLDGKYSERPRCFVSALSSNSQGNNISG